MCYASNDAIREQKLNTSSRARGESRRYPRSMIDDSLIGPSAVRQSKLSRRAFVKLAAGSGVALVFGRDSSGSIIASIRSSRAAPDFRPNQWIAIGQDDVVTIRVGKTEMGQGVRTSLPAIAAAELGADWPRVRVEQAEPGPDFSDMGTSGSGSVIDSWMPLREAAAAARAVLTRAAAAQFGVGAEECVAENGVVVHAASSRRATFGSLVAAAAELPVPAKPVLRPASDLHLLGTRLKRTDTPAIVRGAAVYGIDVRVPNMKFAVIARPPAVGATARRWNEAAARAVPGVTGVSRVPSGFAVIASNTWAAMEGRKALAVEWETQAGDAAANSAAFTARLESALGEGKRARREGDADAAMRTAKRTLSATFHWPFQAHAAMEPLTAVADVRSDRCELWLGTQRANGVQSLAAKMLDLSPERVTVHPTLMGGAFGRRIAIDHAREAIEVSRAIGAPAQVVWSREDDIQHDMYNAAQVNRLTAGLDDDGNIVAWRHQVADYHLSMFGAYDPKYDPASDGDPWGGFDTPYGFGALDVTLAVLESPVPTGAWRSVTYPAAVFARESFLDEIAHATNRDPLALRLSLIPSPGAFGRDNRPNGDRLRNVLQRAAALADWHRAMPRTKDGRRWGRGIACNQYHRGTMVAQVAEVSVGAAHDIKVHRIVTAIDVGRVIDRSGLEAQVEGGVGWALSAALKTRVTFANGRAQQSNFHDFSVLRMREMPRQDIAIVESDWGPFGAGEPPVPAVAPAVANAVFAATGRRLRQTPLRLDEA
jgi:isoquinoline 1-oxidoreductase beta subunit